jgi:hypothetical protein
MTSANSKLPNSRREGPFPFNLLLTMWRGGEENEADVFQVKKSKM